MKQLFATCVLIASMIPLEFANAQESAGIDFATMPVGCRWQRELSNGQIWLEEFVGRKGKSYIVRTVNAKNPSEFISTVEFNRDGHRTRLTWANGSWSTFSPFSCFAVLGKCSYIYENSDGERKQIDSTATLKGGILITRSRSGTEEFAPERTALGPFRVWKENKSPNYWTRVTKFERCGLSS
ncbi:MAG: hypothetical protein ACKVPY_17925 [Paracoccaceae bacterium]